MNQRFNPFRYIDYLLTGAAGLLLIKLSLTYLFEQYHTQCSAGGERPGLQIAADVWQATGRAEQAGIIIGSFVFLIALIKFMRCVRRDLQSYVVLKSDTGSVRVQASAIEQALRYTAKSISGVHDIRVRLVIDKQTGVPAAGEVEARVSDITNIVSVHDALSRVLAERYEQIIPGAPPIDFHLTIKHHFKPPSKPKKKKNIVPPEEDETKAVRAPQYPVPKDDNY